MELITSHKKLINLKPRGFWPGFIIGLFYFGWTFWFFWSVQSLLLSGVNSQILTFVIILLPLAITVASMSFFWGILSFVFFRSFKIFRLPLLPILFASTFVLTEYLRSWFYGILWFGRENLLGAHWTFGNPAYILSDFDLIRESASVWGIYGVNFVVIFLITALILLIKSGGVGKKFLFYETITVAIVLFLISSLSPADLENKGDKLTLSVIQTKNPVKVFYDPDELLDDFGRKNELLKEAAKRSDVVVFPESANFSKTLSGFLNPVSAKKYFNNLSQENILIIDSNSVPEQGNLKSKTLFIDSRDGVIDFYDKLLLTPGGETIPYLAKIPLLLVRYFWDNDYISSQATFSKGNQSNVISYGANKIKTLVCSDLISPGLSRSGGMKYGFIINQNSMAVFDGNRQIERQLLSMAQFRAAENEKYLIISSNYGRSYIVNPAGNVENSSDSDGYKILTGDVVPNQNRTWYNKLGDWPILLLSLVIFGLGLIKLRNANQDKNFS